MHWDLKEEQEAAFLPPYKGRTEPEKGNQGDPYKQGKRI